VVESIWCEPQGSGARNCVCMRAEMTAVVVSGGAFECVVAKAPDRAPRRFSSLCC
jgi:hypothetical protein